MYEFRTILAPGKTMNDPRDKTIDPEFHETFENSKIAPIGTENELHEDRFKNVLFAVSLFAQIRFQNP